MNKERQLKAFPSEVSVVEGERAVVARITTDAVDRDGEVIIPQGVNSKDFERNPVVYFNHSYADFFTDDTGKKLPVGKCVAIKREENGIIAKTVFADRPQTYPEDKEWLPDTLFSLFQQKILNTFSIGFLPVEVRPATDKDLATFGADCRRVISKLKMLEYSVAPLPCNPEAVTMAVSKGLLTLQSAEKLFGKAVETPNSDEKPPETDEKAAEDAAPMMAACKTCGKEYDISEMQMTEGEDGAASSYICKERSSPSPPSASGTASSRRSPPRASPAAISRPDERAFRFGMWGLAARATRPRRRGAPSTASGCRSRSSATS
jgi:hypothetical protein